MFSFHEGKQTRNTVGNSVYNFLISPVRAPVEFSHWHFCFVWQFVCVYFFRYGGDSKRNWDRSISHKKDSGSRRRNGSRERRKAAEMNWGADERLFLKTRETGPRYYQQEQLATAIIAVVVSSCRARFPFLFFGPFLQTKQKKREEEESGSPACLCVTSSFWSDSEREKSPFRHRCGLFAIGPFMLPSWAHESCFPPSPIMLMIPFSILWLPQDPIQRRGAPLDDRKVQASALSPIVFCFRSLFLQT